MRIGTFTCFCVYRLVQIFLGKCIIVQGFMSGKRIWIIDDVDNRLVKFREVQQCWKSTSGQPVLVHLQPVPVHPCRKVAETNLYRYTTNLYRYTCVRTAGIEQEFESNARARSSFNYQCGIIMKRGIKAIGYKKKEAFDS